MTEALSYTYIKKNAGNVALVSSRRKVVIRMTCSCGAQMCYICKQPVRDYSHFNGIGGDKFNLLG
ncbi:hypothetical protein NQ317_010376 [Molorchus minor]|uniref:Uncharacterized protein n=1 Tax=Molorchus minor TaxID=1323400 RepID=A0ABQ9IUV8_9CUCU|nr:hypothetical protein NQ317_010376 [Molorchus minor]